MTLGLSFRRRERGWPMPPAAPSTATLKPRCCWVAMVARCRKQDAKIQARTCARQRRRPTPPRPPPPSNEPRTRRPRHGCCGAAPGRASAPPRGHAHALPIKLGTRPPHPVGEATAESRKEAQQVGCSARVRHAPEPPGACTHGQVGDKGLGVTQHEAEDTGSTGPQGCKGVFPGTSTIRVKYVFPR